MLVTEDSLIVVLRNTATSINQTVVIANDQSNFIFFVRSRTASLVPQTDTAAVWLSEGHQTMIASERVLARDWNRPEEDDAWANL
jgi:hypothetical protein